VSEYDVVGIAVSLQLDDPTHTACPASGRMDMMRYVTAAYINIRHWWRQMWCQHRYTINVHEDSLSRVRIYVCWHCLRVTATKRAERREPDNPVFTINTNFTMHDRNDQ
jgi:hypothetical protein